MVSLYASAPAMTRRNPTEFLSVYQFGIGEAAIHEMNAEEKRHREPGYFALPFLTVFIVCMGLLIYFLYILPLPSKSTLISDCVSNACHEALAHLDNITNSSISPCLDFFGHVCSSWMKEDSDMRGGFLLDARSALLQKVNKTVMETETVVTDQYGTHIFYALYKSCHHFMMSHSSAPEHPFVTFERHFGTLQSFFNTPYPAVLTTLIGFSLQRGVDSVFSIRLIRNKVRYTLLLTQTRTVQEKLDGQVSSRGMDRYVKSYVLFLLRNLSTSSFSVIEYGQKLVSLDDEVRALFEVEEAVQEIAFANVEHLTNAITSESWLKTVNEFIPSKHRLSRRDKIKTRGFNATRRVLQLLEDVSTNADKHLKIAYLYLQLIAEVLYLDFRLSFLKSEKIHTCLEANQKVLIHSWSYILSKITSTSRTGTILSIYRDVHGVVIRPRYLTWMDTATRIAMFNAVRRVRLTMLETNFNFDANYTNVKVGEPFFENYITMLGDEHRRLLTFPLRIQHFLSNHLLIDSPLAYSKQLSSIVVSSLYEAPPILYSRTEVPEYFDSSTVGILIAVELSKLIGPFAGSSRWSTDTKAKFSQSFQCMMSLYEGMAPTSIVDEPHVVEAVFAWTRSVRMIYDIVRDRLTKTAAQQVFFKRFCLLSCKSHNSPQPLTPRQQCLLPLMNMPEFSEVFQCAKGTSTGSHFCKVL